MLSIRIPIRVVSAWPHPYMHRMFVTWSRYTVDVNSWVSKSRIARCYRVRLFQVTLNSPRVVLSSLK